MTALCFLEGDAEQVGRDLEGWAFTVMRDGVIGEREFSRELPRVGDMLRVYGQRNLYEALVNMTTAGMRFSQALDFLEKTFPALEIAI